MNFLSKIWSTGNFIPHGHCYLWQPELVWLHILSDSLIALAYFSIPIALIYFINQRKDLPYPEIFVLFSAFIIACGLTHLMEVWTLWYPIYWLSGLIKGITAIISLLTAGNLIPLIPKLLALSSPAQLKEINEKLKAEIVERQQIQTALQESEKRLGGILEIAKDAIISVDENQNISMFNQGAERIFGYQVNEVLGKSLNLLLPERYKTNHQHYLRQFSSGTVVSRPMASRHQAWGLRKDGTQFPIASSISKLELKNETILTAIISDITEEVEAENKLKNALQKLNFHVENTPLGVIEWNSEFKVQRWSQQAEKIFGWQAEEILGIHANDWEFIYPEDLEKVNSIMQQLRQGNVPRNISYNRNYTKEGKVINCEWYNSAFFDEKSNLISILSLVLDVTDWVQAQLELQLSEQKLQLIINNIPQSIFWKNKDLVYQGCNYSFANKAGFKSPAEIVGKNDYDLPGNQEYFEHYRRIDREVIESNTPRYQIIEPQLTTQGQQRWLQTSKVPIHNQNGEVIGILGSYEDITERIAAQEKLDQQQKTLRAILDNSPIWIWMTNVDGKVQFVNKTFCENLGIPESRFLEVEKYYQLFPHKEAEIFQKYDAGCWRYNLPCRSEEIFTFIDGKEHNIELIKVKIKDDDNKVIGLMYLGLDITESKQAQQQLQASEAQFRLIARYEELLNHLAIQIRHSLDIDTILATTVYEVRTILKIDRCHFIWHRLTDSLNTEKTNNNNLNIWEIVNESKAEFLPSLVGEYTKEQVGSWALKFLQLEIIQVDDISLVNDRKMQDFIGSFGIISLVSIPIKTQSGKIGILFCANHTSVHKWDDREVKLLKAVTDQLAIAIDQAELYHKSRETAFQAKARAMELSEALQKLQQAQTQLIQTEKMSSLGQMVAGIAHEINNPINFISGNITYLNQYTEDLLNLIHLYQENYPHPPTVIQEEIESIELEFLIEDLPKTLNSMKIGTKRIVDIVLSLRNFSRLDESEVKSVDIHEGIESTLLILQNKLKQKLKEKEIQVIKNYNCLPKVECYVSQINQVFMNIISNAIDALAEKRSKNFYPTETNQSSNISEDLPIITISTKVISSEQVRIIIADNGMGMTETVRKKIFDPFFTTKPIGTGTGLGLSISYQIIVEKHQGKLNCISTVGQGTKFIIEIPILQKTLNN
ncbi:PAS domain S-box protein [Okeania sp.]|uniref:PAS domain S-box protein n=1 Tax=Okeania sp. TaxID=3100323 RepID=UPI002B4AD45F|nr:PAS domain S-box protein [Okeania sp.]MEB3340419.1 PAS domain S-box protein [Okeania sp.]